MNKHRSIRLHESVLPNKIIRHGVVAQLGERCVRNAEVGSSILLRSTNTLKPNFIGWFFLGRSASISEVPSIFLLSGTSRKARLLAPTTGILHLPSSSSYCQYPQ